MLVVRRTRVHSPLLAGVLGTAMLLCGIGVAIVGLVDAAVDDGARAVAAQHAGVDLALRVSLDLAEDPERQDAQVRAALARSLVGLSAPWSVDRTVAGEVRLTSPGRDGSTEERAVTAVSIGDLAGRVDLVAGSWAADDADVVVQADAADELGLRPGDDILLDDVPLHVAGTWRVRDHLDPRWLGDPQVTTGKADGQLGPMVVAGSRWPEMLEVPRARWVLVPDLDEVTAADLDAVARARDDLQTDWTGRVDDVDSLDVDGRLVDVAHEVALRTDGLRAGEPVVLLLLAAVGLVTLAALARLFASTHGQELALLWARGASTGSLARSAAVETSVAAAVGGTVGALVAGAAVLVAQDPARPTAITLAGIVTVLAVTASAAGLDRTPGPPRDHRHPHLARSRRSCRATGGPGAGDARGGRRGPLRVAAPGVRLPGHRALGRDTRGRPGGRGGPRRPARGRGPGRADAVPPRGGPRRATLPR